MGEGVVTPLVGEDVAVGVDVVEVGGGMPKFSSVQYAFPTTREHFEATEGFWDARSVRLAHEFTDDSQTNPLPTCKLLEVHCRLADCFVVDLHKCQTERL
jgi:hypothetical protein